MEVLVTDKLPVIDAVAEDTAEDSLSADEIQESERRYLEQYLRSPFLPAWRYFWKAIRNIVFRGKRSR